ncbi:MAG: arginine--tRNA ligase [Promethearchaeota archaeon]
MDYKKVIDELFRKVYPDARVCDRIEIPPKNVPGDYGIPCFFLAKQLRRSPVEIAKDSADRLRQHLDQFPAIKSVQSAGPYVNFFIDEGLRARNVLSTIAGLRGDYGRGSAGGKVIVVEYPAPNTNKPLHLGHVRNMLLGQTVSNVLAFRGHEVHQVNLNNDRGIHICKSMLAYQLWGDGRDPDVKSDHFVGKFYVKFAQESERDPSLNEKAAKMLRDWEAGEPGVRALWEKMNQWALGGFHQTYEKFGIEFEKEYFESEIYEGGRDLVREGLQRGIFKERDDGAVFAELGEFGLPDKVLLRSDGTSVYMTQDLFLAKKKFEDFNYDLSIYVVGNEQKMHFQRLFKILELLDIPGNNFHFAYGMITLPEGRMKSREGKVVDADDMVEEMVHLASKEVEKRHPGLGSREVLERGTKIGMAALRFFILKYDPVRDFVFNPEESLSFEGETGPYIQYVYARISSILRKSGVGVPTPDRVDFGLLTHEKEVPLLELLERFPEVIASGEDYKLHLVARYLLDLCQAFNEFYHSCPVNRAEPPTKEARLLLIECVRVVVETGLKLFGIETLEEM